MVFTVVGVVEDINRKYIIHCVPMGGKEVPDCEECWPSCHVQCALW